MSRWQKGWLAGIVLGMGGLGTVLVLPGCGSGSQSGGVNEEVKITPVVNPAPGAGSVPIEEEYKNMDPGGKVQ